MSFRPAADARTARRFRGPDGAERPLMHLLVLHAAVPPLPGARIASPGLRQPLVPHDTNLAASHRASSRGANRSCRRRARSCVRCAMLPLLLMGPACQPSSLVPCAVGSRAARCRRRWCGAVNAPRADRPSVRRARRIHRVPDATAEKDSGNGEKSCARLHERDQAHFRRQPPIAMLPRT